MYYLYVKTHNITGLKYLGKTIQDPYKYKGSGKRWLKHIVKHGYDVSTSILLVTECETELKETGKFFSEFFNVVADSRWANLKIEEGDGGATFKGRTHKPETIALMRQNALQRPPVSMETRSKLSKSKQGQTKGVPRPRSKEHQDNLTKALQGKLPWNRNRSGYKCKSEIVTCPHCGKTGGSGGIKRWHFDNCNSNPKANENIC